MTELIPAAGAPADVIERTRSNTWVTFQEPETWSTGVRATAQGDVPRHVVRVSVPGGHLDARMADELVRRVTRVLASTEEDPSRLEREPRAWVQIVEISDGRLGVFGRVVGTADVIALNLHGRMPEPRSAPPAEAAETRIDPVCGMTVTPGEDAIPLEAEGVTYAFCSAACREIFERERTRSRTA
ncbi:MAG TPA: YHS domain-containing protein [Longimicrobiales bacterium]|nr:YHS domain-containing protein [Longimicrobiales bacterium]